MKNKSILGCASLLLTALMLQQDVLGYEIDTHAEMSREAAKRSTNLADNLPNLGLSSLTEPLAGDGGARTVLGWIQEGAKREDDTISEVFARYRNHFYDPISGRGFGGIWWPNSGIAYGMPAPDWALDKGPADGQLFSFRQARQYLFDGLTQPTKADRESNLALMFRTLGDVVHVVQDMAQPQHTRNDGHGDGSLYELYTDEKRDSLSYSGAAIPSFFKARDLFANSSGTGLAQYSNGNFVSAGTNFRYQNGQMLPSGNYAYPTPGPNIQSVSVQDLDVSPLIKSFCGQDPACNMRFVSGTNDRGETRGYAATLSIFYDDLKQYNVTLPDLDLSPYFSLNRFNFDAAHKLLIPSAVGYSAGMLDYFFRGRIDFVPDSGNPGHYVIKNPSSEDMSGTFTLYFDMYGDGRSQAVRRTVPEGQWSLTIPADGQSGPLAFVDMSGATDQVNPNRYLLVFRGKLGEEDGVVVAKHVDAAGAPEFFTEKYACDAEPTRTPIDSPYVYPNIVRKVQDPAGYAACVQAYPTSIPAGDGTGTVLGNMTSVASGTWIYHYDLMDGLFEVWNVSIQPLGLRSQLSGSFVTLNEACNIMSYSNWTFKDRQYVPVRSLALNRYGMAYTGWRLEKNQSDMCIYVTYRNDLLTY